jgi:hypothetical protein
VSACTPTKSGRRRGLAGRAAQLAAGTTRSAEALGVLTSAEAADVQIQADYHHFLGRAAEATGLATWEQALLSGLRDEQFLADVVASDEYFSRTVP